MRGSVDPDNVERLLCLGESHGLARAEMKRAAGLDSCRRGPRIPAGALIRLWEFLGAQLDGSGVAVAFAEATELDRLGLFGFCIQTAASVEDALRVAADLFPLVTDSGTWRGQFRDRAIEFAWERSARCRGAALSNEAVLANFVHCARQIASSDFEPERVCFQHPAPSGVQPLERHFDCPVLFDAPLTGFRVARSRLTSRPRLANVAMHAFLRTKATQALQSLESPTADLDIRVRRCIARRLAEGDITADSVAAELGVSRRSLHRQLGELGTNFRDLLCSVRKEQALALVERDTIPLTRVGHLLGFAGSASFTRAFRAWFGEAPSSRRNRQR